MRLAVFTSSKEMYLSETNEDKQKFRLSANFYNTGLLQSLFRTENKG